MFRIGLWGCFFNHFILIKLFCLIESYVFDAGRCVCCCFLFCIAKGRCVRHLEFDWSKKRVCVIIGSNWRKKILIKWLNHTDAHHIYVETKTLQFVHIKAFINLYLIFIRLISNWLLASSLFLIYLKLSIYFSCAFSGHLFLTLIKYFGLASSWVRSGHWPGLIKVSAPQIFLYTRTV